MQLHTTADGQEHGMSVESYPTGPASTSHQQRVPQCVADKHIHWWPSQAYHCNFCSRVFRTAQALGGHMNIHRRERAFANDTGTNFHTCQGDSQTSNSILCRSSSHPAATLDHLRSSLFSSTPSASASGPCPIGCKEIRYGNRRIAVAPDTADSSTHPLTTANFFAPIQAAGMTCPRVGWNGGDAGRLEESSDPPRSLYSQLPPPGFVPTLQRQQPQLQQNPQQQQCRGGNILMQNNLAKPYHRDAVPVRPTVGYPSAPFGEAGGSWIGEREHGDEDLDLELRL